MSQSPETTDKKEATLNYTGEKINGKPKITVFTYNNKTYKEHNFESVEECLNIIKRGNITWINVDGLKDQTVVQRLGDHFKLHSLIQEDILQTEQRPKLDEDENYLFLVLKMLSYDETLREVVFEQVSLVVTKDAVISFQDERKGDVFDGVRDRIRTGKGLVRGKGTDYLAYSLIDAIVDHYFVVIEKIGDGLEELEDETVENPTVETVHKIHELKKQMIIVRKAVWPFRDVISHMERCGNPLINEGTQLYLRDVYDHLIQIIDTIETYRDILSGMLDIYLSSISNRMNEIMKVLTIVGTVFIPLTFIAGLYGMNFRYMPELEQWWGYPLTLLIMAATGGYMIWYVRKKKWL